MQGTILLFFTFLLPSWAYQQLECFDDAGGVGNLITLDNGRTIIPDLAKEDFDDRIQSCNFRGVYVLYDIELCNNDNLTVSKYTRRRYCHFSTTIYFNIICW